MDRGPRCIAVGIVPDVPSVFWDYDLIGIGWKTGWDVLHSVIAEMGINQTVAWDSNGRPFSVYKTKHGLHLIIRCKTWDEAQMWLYLLKQRTGASSIMNCRKQRIRISPKIAEVGGQEVSPVPVNVWSNWGADLRTGRKEVYYTYDEGLDSGVTELPP